MACLDKAFQLARAEGEVAGDISLLPVVMIPFVWSCSDALHLPAPGKLELRLFVRDRRCAEESSSWLPQFENPLAGAAWDLGKGLDSLREVVLGSDAIKKDITCSRVHPACVLRDFSAALVLFKPEMSSLCKAPWQIPATGNSSGCLVCFPVAWMRRFACMAHVRLDKPDRPHRVHQV